MGRQTHHHEHGEKDHRGAGVALELAQQHGHQSVAPQQHHVQGVVNKPLFAQGVQVLAESQAEEDFHQLGGLERPARDVNPRPGVHAAAALDRLAKNGGVNH